MSGFSELAGKANEVCEAFDAIMSIGESVPVIGSVCSVAKQILVLAEQKAEADDICLEIFLTVKRLHPVLSRFSPDNCHSSIRTQLNELDTYIKLLFKHMNEWSKKRSIMKMLGSSKATSKFRDDLNQLDRVIKALDTCVGTDTNLAVHNNAEKLDALLEKANITTSEEPKDEFQILFNRLKAGAGHEKGVMSCLLDDSFVTSFESVFLDDDDIEDEETKEALLRTLDKNDDGDITEAEFKKFYKKFLKSGVGMAEYLKVVKNEDAEKQAAIQKAEEEEEERQRREEEEEERRWQAEQNNDDTAGATTAPSTAAATTSAPTGFYIAVKCAEGEKITASWNVQYPKSSDYIALVQEGNSEENYVTYEYNSGASKKGELAIDASGSCSRGMKYFLSYINGDTYKKADGVANSRLFKLFDEDSKLKPKAKKKVKEVVRVKSIDFNRINVQWKVNDPVSDYDYIELVDDGGNSCTYAYNTNKANEGECWLQTGNAVSLDKGSKCSVFYFKSNGEGRCAESTKWAWKF